MKGLLFLGAVGVIFYYMFKGYGGMPYDSRTWNYDDDFENEGY